MDEPKKVYAVSEGEYSDYHICALFSTREGAERYHAEKKKTTYGRGLNDIEEWGLDAESELVARECWQAEINERQGTVAQGTFYDKIQLASPQARSEIQEFENRHNGHWLRVTSYISQDHADAVAIEQWQMRLMDGRWKSDWQPPPEPPRPAPSRPVSRPTAAEQAFARASKLIDERGTT